MLAGCPLSTPVLELESRGAASMLVVTIEAGETVVEAFDLDGEAYLSVPLEGRDAVVYSLHYGCQLAALELEPGRQALAQSQEYGRPLPEAAETHRSRIEDGRSTAPEQVDRPPELLELALRTSAGPCVDFEVATFEVPGTLDGQVPVALPLDGNRALLVTSDARVFEASIDGLVELARASTTAVILGGFRAGDGELLLWGTEGRTLRGRVGESFIEGPRLRSRGGFNRTYADGDRSGPLGEVFVVDATKSFERLFDESWTPLNEEVTPSSFERGGVAWLGPKRAAATGLDIGPLARWDDGTLTVEALPLEAPELVRAIRSLPRYGLVIATSAGGIQQQTGAGWSLLHEQLGGLRTLDRLDHGLFFGGGEGFFDQLHPRYGTCGSIKLARRDVALTAELAGGFVLVTDLSLGLPTEVTVVIRSEPPLPDRCPLTR